mmetsp:Transcript_1716/g.6320  ORF Transcript_1716/g.6320 Transcript_1716/m.6320 type:complete len:116 (+) Transcript_1716:376-723(+)
MRAMRRAFRICTTSGEDRSQSGLFPKGAIDGKMAVDRYMDLHAKPSDKRRHFPGPGQVPSKAFVDVEETAPGNFRACVRGKKIGPGFPHAAQAAAYRDIEIRSSPPVGRDRFGAL